MKANIILNAQTYKLQTWIIQNLNSFKLQVQYASDRNTLPNLTNLAQIRQIPSF